MSHSDQPPLPRKRRQFLGPKGARDFYPEDLLRRRYIEKAWRDTSIRHGFEEIEGPTIEQAELYAVKSGEGILGEMFNVFSGKDPEEVAEVRRSGRAPLALRPEFTPTLARMYAARAAQLPRPVKWFTAGPFFRAEKPQRGRLREFCQWNCDVVGADPGTDALSIADVEVIAAVVDLLALVGLSKDNVQVHVNERGVMREIIRALGVSPEKLDEAIALLDIRERLADDELHRAARALNLDLNALATEVNRIMTAFARGDQNVSVSNQLVMIPETAGVQVYAELGKDASLETLRKLIFRLNNQSVWPWITINPNIVRGLAYYTGMVFEVRSDGERAVAGGGRYDNLIELFGGPTTPAVGFGMGDVVLGNLLHDKDLMPGGQALLEALSAPSASLRPDVFVIANEKEESQAALRPLVARLRRGEESDTWKARDGRKPWDKHRYSIPPLHARNSYKATKNIGKLLEDARKCAARFAAIIENAEECTLKNLDTGEQEPRVKLAELASRIASRSANARP
jgi:histidyl-tRNA synthetase